MLEILHNFFAGITFAAGITVGAILCRIATKEGRKELPDEVKSRHAVIEERLSGSLKCHERMAVAMELMARKSDGKNVAAKLAVLEKTDGRDYKQQSIEGFKLKTDLEFWRDMPSQEMRLRCGEMSAQEILTVRAVLGKILSANNKIKQ